MYYIVREGIKHTTDHEYRSLEGALILFNRLFNSYQHDLEQNVIPCFTCLLLTKGVQNNEETESIKH